MLMQDAQHALCLGAAGEASAGWKLITVSSSAEPSTLAQEVLDAATVSNLITGHAAAGQLFWALHYWLALRQQAASPSLQAQQALLCACRDRNAWQPALHILNAMLASRAGSVTSCTARLAACLNTPLCSRIRNPCDTD